MSTTSRQRVLDALNFKEGPVPVDFGGHRSSAIAALAYIKLKNALGISSGDIYVYDVMGQLAIVEPEVLDALGVDTVELGRAFCTQPQDWKEWTLPGGIPCKIPAYVDVRKKGDDWFIHNMKSGEVRAIQVNGSLCFERIQQPFADYELDEGVDVVFEKWASGAMTGTPPPGGHFDMTKEAAAPYAEQARAFRAQTNRAVIGVFGGSLFEVTHWLFGMENDLVQMSACPDEYEQLVHRVGDRYLQELAVWLDAFGDSVDVVLFVDDFGAQSGLLMAPEMYRRYFLPVHKKMWQLVHERSAAKVNLHSCGSIDSIIPDLMGAGLDALNPVQITCEGMDAASLKQRFGDKLTLWGGGCDTRDILPRGTAAQIREHVLRQCEILAPRGGFVFQQVQNIMAEVPPQNIIAMFEAVKEFNAGRPGA